MGAMGLSFQTLRRVVPQRHFSQEQKEEEIAAKKEGRKTEKPRVRRDSKMEPTPCRNWF